MARAPLSRHRTRLLVLCEECSAGTQVLPNAHHPPPRRYASAHSSGATHSPKRASLLSDSHRHSVSDIPEPCGRLHYPSSYEKPHHSVHNGTRGGDSRYREVACSLGARRLSPQRAGTAGAYAGRSAANDSCAADAIAFHYYSQQHPKQAQVQSVSSSHEYEVTSTPVCQQPSASAYDSSSAPVTPVNRRAPTVSPNLSRRSSNHSPVYDHGGEINAYLHNFPPALPSPAEHQGIIRDTTTSLVPLTSSLEEGSWPVELTPSQHQQCEDLVRLLAQLPAAQAHRVLLATIHQYEAQRLLQYYGGPHALCVTQNTLGFTPKTPSLSSLTSSPVKVRFERRQDDGRSALLETLQARFHDMQRADLAAQALSPFAAAANQRRRWPHAGGGQGTASGQSHAHYRIAAPPPVPPPQRPARRPQLARRHTPQNNAGKSLSPPNAHRSGAGDAGALHQRRGRVLASRAVKPRSSSLNPGGCKRNNGRALHNAEGSSKGSFTPLPLDLRQMIEPSHRHEMAGALLGEPCVLAEVEPVAHNPSSGERAFTLQDAREIAAKEDVGKTASAENLPKPLSTLNCSDGASSPTAAATIIPTTTGIGAQSAGIDRLLDMDPTLSPGANAARQVYWEQQQKDLEQRLSCSLSKLSCHENEGDWRRLGLFSDSELRSRIIHDERNTTCRYPRSTPSDHFGTLSGKTNTAGHDGASLEDSVRRSEVLSDAHSPTVNPVPPGTELKDVTAGGLTKTLSSRSLAAPLPQIPGVILYQPLGTSAEGASSPQERVARSIGMPEGFLTDITDSLASALSVPKALFGDRVGSDRLGTPAESPHTESLLFGGVDCAAAKVGVSSELNGCPQYEEGGNGVGHCTRPPQTEQLGESVGPHQFSFSSEVEESISTASSMVSETFFLTEASRGRGSGGTALTAHSAGEPVTAGSRAVNEYMNEFKLPWEV
ncbi:hypothetical protein JKF63_03658 [Porcisia hertigi]|uniref:Uncharacterized protein n=1 Tax=Porcisia hertigi TaxID=2761500 RepID=A0A836HWR4_9TRYP|nr:hypothetical protein JKF63_03658 [Porcisia hertigi]